MGPHDRQLRAIPALARFWDAFLQGRPAGPGDLDPSLAETVRRLHARDDVPGADADFAANLSAQLEDQMSAMHLSQTRLSTAHTVPDLSSSNGRVDGHSLWPSRTATAPARPRGQLVTQLVSAALVVLALAAGYFAFGPLRDAQPGEQLSGPPAVVAPGTPGSDVTGDETLAAVTIPAGTLPPEVIGGLNLFTVAAGSEGTWDWTCCTGVRLTYVLDGTYALTSVGSTQIWRAGGGETWQEVAPGSEVVLESGDAMLSRMEDSFDGANTGTAPAELLDAVFFTGSPLDDPVPYDAAGSSSWKVFDQDIWGLPLTVPEEDLILRLRQTSIDAVSELPLPPAALIQLAVSPEEGAVPSTQEDFDIKNYGPDPIGIYAATLEHAGDAPLADSSSTP